MVKDFLWTSEKLAELASDKIKIVRANAITRANNELVLLCENELADRAPSKKPRVASQPSKKGKPVKGFHFICKRDHGVTRNPDGTFWSGTWVVAKERADHGEKIDAYIALHEKKSEPSYLQGIIRGWRTATRDRQYADVPVQTEEGIDFLIEPISDSLLWKGDGAGEKGYWYGEQS
ncbi:MAG TPA: hypothetical protein VNO32_54430 [Candidatus Acidoferrum sp.]|nr:hypothetical protein [Candidatus Acidoferrum sp.]